MVRSVDNICEVTKVVINPSTSGVEEMTSSALGLLVHVLGSRGCLLLRQTVVELHQQQPRKWFPSPVYSTIIEDFCLVTRDLSSRGCLTVEVSSLGLVPLETHPPKRSGSMIPHLSISQDTGQPQFLTVNIGSNKMISRRSPDVALQLGPNPVHLGVAGGQPGLLHGPPGDGAGHNQAGDDDSIIVFWIKF